MIPLVLGAIGGGSAGFLLLALQAVTNSGGC